jgi:hypothetical protein
MAANGRCGSHVSADDNKRLGSLPPPALSILPIQLSGERAVERKYCILSAISRRKCVVISNNGHRR